MSSVASSSRTHRARHLLDSAVHPAKRRRLSSAARPPYRALLFGADEFSCATLRALYEARHGLLEELTVVVPPDARTGRGMRTVHQPPLRLLAQDLSLPTISLPKTLLKGWEPPQAFLAQERSSNLLLTASFGHLIPSSLLHLFEPLNALNVHPSLLPKYRGAAPIQYTIANGDPHTGVSVQELSRGKFDHGRILAQKPMAVPPGSTFQSLERTLAQVGGELLVQVLRDLPDYQSRAWQQDSSSATLAPKISKDAGRIDWANKSATDLLRWQRGMGHQAPLYSHIGGPDGVTSIIHLQLDEQHESSTGTELLAPGTGRLDTASRQLHISCGARGQDIAVVSRVKPAGSKWLDAWDWWNGQGRRARGPEGYVSFR